MGCGSGDFTIKVHANGTSRTLAVPGLAEGWMDDSHLIIVASANEEEFPCAYSEPLFPSLDIVDVVSGAPAMVAVQVA
jgi:hypothetical protein